MEFRLNWLCLPLICLLLLASACSNPVETDDPLDLGSEPQRIRRSLTPGSLNHLIGPETVTTYNFDFDYTISEEEMAHWLDQLDNLYQTIKIDQRFYLQGPLIAYGYSLPGHIEITVDKDTDDYQELLDYLSNEIVPRLTIESRPVPVLVRKGSPPSLTFAAK